MPDIIPEGITREHIIDAIRALDAGVEHQFGESTGYDVLFEGRRYPPKAVVGIAARHIINRQLGPSDFKGGLKSKCFRVLEGNQFEIVSKGDTSPFPEEVDETEPHIEGAVTQTIVNRYERDPRARAKCIYEYGPVCQVCSMDFKKRYGAIGEGFIHVHHTRQLSDIGEEYEIDPVTDLVPVCPNCHAMLHKRNPPYSVRELQEMLRAVETYSATLDEVLAEARRNKRVCPQPRKWDELYELLPNKRRTGSGQEPSVPLILGAWWHATDMDKMVRLREHIEWASDHGVLETVHQFLADLKEDEWYHVDE